MCLRFGCVENPSQNPTAVVLSVNPALSSNLCSIRAIRSQQRRHMEPETTCSVYLVTIPSQRSFIIIYPLFSAIRQGRRSSGKGLDMKLHHYQKKNTTNYERILHYLPSELCFAADNCRDYARWSILVATIRISDASDQKAAFLCRTRYTG